MWRRERHPDPTRWQHTHSLVIVFLIFPHEAQNLEEAKSRVQEQDQENGSGQTPKLTHPTQLSDTPQEEALRLDLWEVSKNPNYSKASVRKAQERIVDGFSGVLMLSA